MIEGSRIMVVYYSKSGRTKKAATKLATMLKADCEELFDRRTYNGALGFMKAGYYALKHKLTNLMPIRHQPINYDIVILCTPIWAGNITPAIRTYCQQNELKSVAWLITCGDPHNTVKQLPTAANLIRTTLVLGQKEVDNDQIEGKLQEFINML